MALLRKSKLTVKGQDALWSYFFIGPWLIGLVALTIGPMIASLYYSFTEYDILTPPNWIGLENYTKLLGDPLFWQSLKVTLQFALLALPLHLIIGYLLAVLLNQKVPGLNLWRTLYYLPSVISGVAVAVLWSRLFNPNLGWINYFLKSIIGINQPPGWLQDPQWAVPALIIMSLWSVGGTMIIYLSGLQGVPTALYEAARVDGANKFQSFVNITLPMTSPVIFFNLVIGLIRYLPILYRGLHNLGWDGRPGALDPVLQPVPVPKRLRVFRYGLRFGHGLDLVLHRAGPDPAGLQIVCSVGILRRRGEVMSSSANQIFAPIVEQKPVQSKPSRQSLLEALRSVKGEELVNKIMTLIVLTIGAVVILLPMVFMFGTSVKDKAQLKMFPPPILPYTYTTVVINGETWPLYAVTTDSGKAEMALVKKAPGGMGFFVDPKNPGVQVSLKIKTRPSSPTWISTGRTTMKP